MEADEEDVSKVNEPSLPQQDGAVSLSQTQEVPKNTESQCHPESVTGVHVAEETEFGVEMNVAGGHVTGETEVDEEMDVPESHVTDESKAGEETDVAEARVTDETEVKVANVDEGRVTDETEVEVADVSEGRVTDEKENEVAEEIDAAESHVVEETDVGEEMDVAEGYVADETMVGVVVEDGRVADETEVGDVAGGRVTDGAEVGIEDMAEGCVRDKIEVRQEMDAAEGRVTDEIEVEEQMDAAEGPVTEETEVGEEIDVASATEVGDVVDNALEIKAKVLPQEAGVVHTAREAEESTVVEMAEETILSSKDEVEDKTDESEGEGLKAKEDVKLEEEEVKVEGEEIRVEAEKEEVSEEEEEAEVDVEEVELEEEGEEAEGEGLKLEAEGDGVKLEAEGDGVELEAEGDGVELEAEGEEAEAEADDEDNADMVADTNTVEEVVMADDVMEETTEAEDAEAAEEEAEGMEVEEAVEEEEARNTPNISGKRKRRKGSKATGKLPSKKKMEEDVCFICFDGGELVLCDRRGCPKVYHPSCVNRDDAFFQTKGRWNCGWHLCSNCEKNAHYMCYTCTYSLCKGCIKDAVILCVRGNKGFCETCMKTIMLIEKNEQGNKDVNQVDFDDKTSWEYLFKDYWIDLKGRLSLTLDELAQAKNPWKRSSGHANRQESRGDPHDVNNDGRSDSDNSENLESVNSKKRKAKKRMRTRSKRRGFSSPATEPGSEGPTADDGAEWASKELLEFVMHMRNGDKSALSQFEVQALLLEYIKRNKLRDPRKKSHIICDIRFQNLFGKPRVGHFEMLKLLESHFLVREDSQVDDLQGSVVDTEGNQLDTDGNSDTLVKASKDKKRKIRKKDDGRGLQSNIDDFAAIDIHNISLIYLRRNLVEDLLDDFDNFQDKVANSFVRIRISGAGQKQDLYRLVQVVGTCKAAEPYKVGKRTTDILLEILNLNKKEIISIDIISNQEFTEDECKRLRQSIKCGLINRLTVGDVQDKAMVLQTVRVKDLLETETVRLSHLRDRASEKGRRKELRECVEKLQLLKTPEERQRRLEEALEIHADPNMDPSYESEEEEQGDDKRQEVYMRPTGSGFGRKGSEPISPRRGVSSTNDSWSGSRNYSNMNRELNRNMSNKGFFYKAENTTGAGEIVNDSWGGHGRDREKQQVNHWDRKQNISSSEAGVRSTQSLVPSESSPAAGVSENSVAHLSTGTALSVTNTNESEKIWHYKDPSGKVQGPFSMVQLRKWNNTGYFPANLRVWKNTENEEDSVLVTDAVAGKFEKDLSLLGSSFPKVQMVHDPHLSPAHSVKPQGAMFQRSQNEVSSSSGRANPSLVDVPKYSSDGWGTTNLPSPTPSQTPSSGSKGQGYESKWSSPVYPSSSVSGRNGRLQPTAVATPESAHKYENATHLGASNALQMHGRDQVTGSAPVLPNASMNQVADVKNLVSNLQNLVQSVTSRNPAGDTQGWGSGSVPTQEMTASVPVPGSESQPWGGAPSQRIELNNATAVPAQHPAHGYWSNAPPTNSTGNVPGNFLSTGFSGVPQSDPWRPPVAANQSYIQQPPLPVPPQPQVPWGSGVTDNQISVPRTGQENQNAGWALPMVGNPNASWGGPLQGNANMNWRAPVQGPGWTAPGNGAPSWVPPSQGPSSVSTNHGWAPPPGQGPAMGNTNPGWGAPPSVNPGGMRGGEQIQNGDRFSNQRDRGGPHGGDSGFGGANPWNRQSSFGGSSGGGGGSSRAPFKGQRVCRFFESGHCKKGAACDYLHPEH